MGNPESGSDLETVANLVRLSETAPMPRIDGSEPPPLVRPRADRAEETASAFGGVLDASTGSPIEQLAKRGPIPVVEPPAAETAPPVERRHRYGVFAGAAVVLCAGLGSWALWPSASGGTDPQPVQPPPAPAHTSAPPAVSTLSASPAPASEKMRDTVIRASSRPATTAPPPKVQPTQEPRQEEGGESGDSMEDAFRSAVSSYMREWGGGGHAGPHRSHG
ncbi:hypothetical protein [Amycolatopsis silviterrae]|uniref:Uncharacterized protein n=1 Tax=Amycolatopsis silviterrae TaxID=1656914 RepID=A0ABW5HNS1_9PSEU